MLIDGPWQDDPNNPVIKTWVLNGQKRRSCGHATLFTGPNDQWWMIYHGYENGYWTLGRQALLEPVRWKDDGWLEPQGGDLSSPIDKPVDRPGQIHGQPLSDDFSTDRFGLQWSFYDPSPGERTRFERRDRSLYLKAKGTTPGDSSPLTCIAGDQSYEIEVGIEVDEATEAGMVLFYNRRLYAGLGLGHAGLVMHRYGLQRARGIPPGQRAAAAAVPGRLRIRMSNLRNILTIYTSLDDGRNWAKFDVQMEVSGYHHNVAYDFLSLRPGLYAAGEGVARFTDFRYRGRM